MKQTIWGKMEFKHIVGICVLVFAGVFLYGAMFRPINSNNDKYAAQIVQAFLTTLGLLVGYYWGSSDGSKKKDDFMINSSTPPTIINSTPQSQTTITPQQLDNKGSIPISDTKDQLSNQ